MHGLFLKFLPQTFKRNGECRVINRDTLRNLFYIKPLSTVDFPSFQGKRAVVHATVDLHKFHACFGFGW
ncbi:hypothetical protein BMETH_1268_0 [methanotrophic bacterial endosymbiont of Bathymodiolus sp.]|nr:hypothetical protein BMETH_1268_0 [methanotrophic bacterial endosymbiont of Bathymodiolus sp.]